MNSIIIHDLKLGFFKYHGTGNDFILVDNRDGSFNPGQELIAGLCHRRFGIGADGLITLDLADGYDFGMKYYNSDGQESTMCGNGGRCIVAFADFLSFIPGNCKFLAADGSHTGSVLSKNGGVYRVKLSMNDVTDYKKLDDDFILDTGSPHLVRFVPVCEEVDVVKEGKRIRYHEMFRPGGINVNFVEEKGNELFVRTYERGVEDETLSCGTGVTASALAFAVKNGLVGGIIPIITRGGRLSLHFERRNENYSGIYLEGPALMVYQGSVII